MMVLRAIRLTSAAKADEGERERRSDEADDRERTGVGTVDEGAAARQRTGAADSRTRAGEAHLVIAEAAPDRALRRERHQSATHSSRLPTMSKAPRADTQALREPVLATLSLALLQSVVPLSGPGSGVPFAPTCHSALVGSRLPALAHASCAWNHVMSDEGVSDGRLRA